ncbi:MAG: NUDIX hydrolase [Halopseudomonas sp.]
MRWTPHATVACIVEHEGRFLLVEEYSNNQRVLNQPAGHLEPNETLLEAVKREVMEETAWEVEVTDLVGFYTYTSPHNQTCYHRWCFIAKPVEHHPSKPLDEVILQALWLSADEIRQQRDRLRSPMVLQAIEDYLAGTRYPLALIQEHIATA